MTIPDIWQLVFEFLSFDTKKDLLNLCLVSREFNSLATPLLYRVLILPPSVSRQKLLKERWEEKSTRRKDVFESLLRRLQDESNTHPRAFVHKVTILKYNSDFNPNFDELFRTLRCLPNLRTVIIKNDTAIPNEFVEWLNCNPRAPEIRLFNESGTLTRPKHLSFVSAIHARVDPFERGRGTREPNRNLLNMQELFFACPKLKSFNLTLHDSYGGCVFPGPPRYSNFQFTGEESFPPIEVLSLDGYKISESEWPHWRDRFPWSTLSSLTVGPKPDTRTLPFMTGYAASLKSLKILAFRGEHNISSKDLDAFLLSFNSLVNLTIKGVFCSMQAITNHRDLVNVYLHSQESINLNDRREVLSEDDSRYLDENCPKIENLELDIERHNGEWPDKILTTLASSFANMRHITLHFELGTADIDNPIKPVLNYESAKELGRKFFDTRRKSSIPDGRMQKLTLKTGEPLRRFPQWEPPLRHWENLYTATFDIRAPDDAGGDVRFVHLQREEYEALQGIEEQDVYYLHTLRKSVEAAVDGAKEHQSPFRRD